jgi:type VI secretion system protein ImpF
MPPIDKQTKMRPSLLDRLADPAAFSSSGSSSFTTESMKRAIQSDVIELLNTKVTVLDVTEDMELFDSIMMFGVPDMISLTGNAVDQTQMMRRCVQAALQRFEPRLANIRVSLSPTNGKDASGKEEKREVKFQVEAVLNMEPYRDLVGFETILELTTGRTKVAGEKG